MRFHKLVGEDAYLCQLLTWMNKKDAYEKSFVGRILRKINIRIEYFGWTLRTVVLERIGRG
jgi:hypothetical protein